MAYPPRNWPSSATWWQSRIQKAENAHGGPSKVWNEKPLSWKSKLRIFNSCVVSVVLMEQGELLRTKFPRSSFRKPPSATHLKWNLVDRNGELLHNAEIEPIITTLKRWKWSWISIRFENHRNNLLRNSGMEPSRQEEARTPQNDSGGETCKRWFYVGWCEEWPDALNSHIWFAGTYFWIPCPGQLHSIWNGVSCALRAVLIFDLSNPASVDLGLLFLQTCVLALSSIVFATACFTRISRIEF